MIFNLGDLVGLHFTEKNIKLGIIIDSKKDNFEFREEEILLS